MASSSLQPLSPQHKHPNDDLPQQAAKLHGEGTSSAHTQSPIRLSCAHEHQKRHQGRAEDSPGHLQVIWGLWCFSKHLSTNHNQLPRNTGQVWEQTCNSHSQPRGWETRVHTLQQACKDQHRSPPEPGGKPPHLLQTTQGRPAHCVPCVQVTEHS